MTADRVKALEHAFMAAVRDRDLAFLEEHLGPRFTLTTGRPGAEVRTRAEWLAITRDRYELRSFAFEQIDVVELGDVAVARCRYVQEGAMDGEDRAQPFLMTDVWAEQAGRAVLVTRHVSPLPPS
jgi:ketosteroid isomerase-like protein